MGTLKVIVRNDALNFMQELPIGTSVQWAERRLKSLQMTFGIQSVPYLVSRVSALWNTIVAQQQQNITVFCLIPNIVLFIVLQKRPSI